MFTSTKNRSPTSSSRRSRSSGATSGFPDPAIPVPDGPLTGAAFSSSRNSAVSSASFSNRPSISGQSNPTCAARELSLCASRRAGIFEDTPESTDCESSAGCPAPCAFWQGGVGGLPVWLCLRAPPRRQPLLFLFLLRLQRLPVAQHVGRSI